MFYRNHHLTYFSAPDYLKDPSITNYTCDCVGENGNNVEASHVGLDNYDHLFPNCAASHHLDTVFGSQFWKEKLPDVSKEIQSLFLQSVDEGIGKNWVNREYGSGQTLPFPGERDSLVQFREDNDVYAAAAHHHPRGQNPPTPRSAHTSGGASSPSHPTLDSRVLAADNQTFLPLAAGCEQLELARDCWGPKSADLCFLNTPERNDESFSQEESYYTPEGGSLSALRSTPFFSPREDCRPTGDQHPGNERTIFHTLEYSR